MGLFDFIFKNKPKTPDSRYDGEFRLLTGHQPHFHSFHGEIYESELVRAAINALATHISKLDVKTFGAAKPAFEKTCPRPERVSNVVVIPAIAL